MSCPKCDGEDWKSARHVHLEGISEISSTTRVSGLGVSRSGIGVGAARARTSGYQQSVLSKLSAPPTKAPVFTIILVIVLILFLLGARTSHAPWMNFVVIALCAVGIVLIYPKEKSASDNAMATYADTRMCSRCGTFYVAGQRTETEEARSPGVFGFAILALIVGVVAFFFFANRPESGSNSTADVQPVQSIEETTPADNQEEAKVQTSPGSSESEDSTVNQPRVESTDPSAANTASRSDSQLEADVVSALSSSKALKTESISVAAAQGEVTLGGSVSSDSARELAGSLAQYVPGVITVRNNLTVGTPSTPEPGTASGTPSGLYRVGGDISAPVALNSVEAEFSDEARLAKYQGICLVSLIVDAQGNPQNPRIVRGLGMGLNDKAIEAVRRYRFRPAMKEGRIPVPVMISVEVNFRLY